MKTEKEIEVFVSSIKKLMEKLTPEEKKKIKENILKETGIVIK